MKFKPIYVIIWHLTTHFLKKTWDLIVYDIQDYIRFEDMWFKNISDLV